MAGWMRFLKRLAIAAALLLITVVGALWLTLRASLPQLDGEIAASGLSAPVSVGRDALGTVIVRGAQRSDVAYALGYVHGQERFFEMDLLRRRASGELAALLGAMALPVDQSARLHRFRQRVPAYLDALPAEQRLLAQRYAAGVNAGLAALGARPFPYLLLGQQPQPWTEADVLLAPLAMYFDLQDSSNSREGKLLQMQAALAPEVYAFLTAAGTAWDAPLVGAAYPDPALPGADIIDLRQTEIADPPPDQPPGSEGIGSNNFAVAGTLTPHGGAIVANDMHLGLRVPNLWFRAQWRYPDASALGGERVVTGVSLPGTPFMVVGSNGQIAWGFTNSYGDWLDFVELIPDPADPNRYLGPQGPEPITVAEERIEVRAGAAQTLQVRETRYGPIVGTSIRGNPLALQWTAHQAEAVNAGLYLLERAGSVDAALDIAHLAGIPGQNLLVADQNGQIAWTLMGRIPARADDNPLLRASTDPAAAWLGLLPPAQAPTVRQPADGRLWTANARTVDGAELALIGDGGYTIGARAAQIRDGLRARERLSEADLLAIQLDDRALFLEPWRARLQALLAAHPEAGLDALSRALSDWNGHADPSSSAYRAVREFRLRAHKRFLLLFVGPIKAAYPEFSWPSLPQLEGALWRVLNEQPAHLLPRGVADWDQWLLAAARDAQTALARDGMQPWGVANATRIRHPLSPSLPGLGWLLDMPAQGLPGDQYMPRVQGPRFGASERMVVAPGHEDQGYLHMPGGQSGHPLSPYYGAGHADWASGKPTPFLPGAPEHELRFVPAG